MTGKQFDLQRFVAAQQPVYDTALAEMQRGKKRSHWMWFIFPQIAGLGFSSTSKFYAISGRQEAVAYLAHPLLGPHLVECAQAILPHRHLSALQIFGSPDDMKLKSSMTLFDALDPTDPVFGRVLDQFFGGARDSRTLDLLAG